MTKTATKTTAQTATNTKKSRIWLGLNGEVYCTVHGGYYLQTAVKSNPKTMNHVTPLNDWLDVTDHPDAQHMTCEVC